MVRAVHPRSAALRTLAPAVAVGLLFQVALAAVAVQSARNLERERRRDAVEDAFRAARELEGHMAGPLAAAHALAALVRRDGRVDDFDRVCQDILADYGGVSALQLAPGGVIREIYPMAGNEAAVGLDLFAHPEHAAIVRETRASRRLTLEGPFELMQGGAAIVGRIPIFRRGADAAETFWGFVAVIIRFPDFLDRSRVGTLELGGYLWSLERPGVGDRAHRFASSVPPPGDDVVVVPVSVPNGLWTLRLAPVVGWSSPARLVLQLLASALVSLVLAALSWRVVRQPEILRRRVAERTAELDEANRRLAAELAERHRAEDARRLAEEQARQAQKMEAIGLLAGGIAHDFNNLLTGIMGYADLLELPSADHKAEAATGIRKAAQRAAALTGQLLGFARRGKYQVVAVDLHALVHEVSGLLARTIDNRIRLEHRLESTAGHVRGDPAQLQQVVLNLAVNARDAMPDGGTITFETREVTLGAAAAQASSVGPGRYVALSVVDTGEGIPAEVHDRIFEPFFTTKPKGRGTGMGLAVVYGIVHNHGGNVHFDTAVGHGTRFTVLLPASDSAPAQPEAPARVPVGRGSRVLVLDDEDVVRDAAASMLRALGYTVAKASSAVEALELVRCATQPFDLAMIDLAMPMHDGVDAVRMLRALAPDLPCLLMTGFGHDDRVQEAREAGFAGFLQKPFGVSELADEVSRLTHGDRLAGGPAPEAVRG